MCTFVHALPQCPNTNGVMECAVGHHGVVCALCKPGWAQDSFRKCVDCPSNSARYVALFAAGCSIGTLLLLYFVSARPMRAPDGLSLFGRAFQWILKLSVLRRIQQFMMGLLSRITTRYLALTCNSDPYAAKAFAKPAATMQSIKILISFMQVVGSLTQIDLEWPSSLQSTFTFFSTLNLNIVQLPSTACMPEQTSFLSRLFLYGLGPIGFILIMLFPCLWVKFRNYNHDVAYATFRTFMSLMLFTIFIVYPPVSRTVISALKCDDPGQTGSYLHADYRINCDRDNYMPIQVADAAFTFLWPVGTMGFLVGLLHWYDVPRLAKRKIMKAEQSAFMPFIIAHAHKQKIVLSSSIHEDSMLEDLNEDDLRVLICAANSVAVGYKPG